MKSFFRALRLNAYAKLATALALALAALFVLFDWNWLRTPLVSYLTEKSGREVRLDDLHVDLEWGEPTVRLRGVYIQNAPWAGDRPFATAAEASFKVSLKSVWEGRPVISRLVLVDADVDMQREADGRRNWRLRHPEDRSPGRITVHTLEAHRTTVRFVNREIDLHFVGVASPLEKPAEDGLSSRITFEGRYEGAPYAGVAFSTGVLSFRSSGVVFPLRGHVTSRTARVELDGVFSDLFDIGTFDAKLRLSGSTLSDLHPFLRIRPPPSRPFRFEAQLTQTHDIYEFRQLKGKIGATDLAGKATYDRSGDRTHIRADLRSERADIADLRPLIGMRPATERARGDRVPGGEPEATNSKGRVLPARPVRVDRLKAFDASIKFEAKKFEVVAVPMVESLRVTADLAGGVLELKPLALGIAGGRVAGTLRMDARQKPVSSRVRMELRDLKLERLVAWITPRARAAGAVRGDIDLSGRGNSVAGMLADATGSFSANVTGGRISNLADAKLGLNFGKVVGLMLRGDRDIPINCAAIALDVASGAGKTRTVMLDTSQTRTTGVGAVKFREKRWELLLNPQPKTPGLLTRHATIRVSGSFRDADVSIEERMVLRGRERAHTLNGDGPPTGCGGSR